MVVNSTHSQKSKYCTKVTYSGMAAALFFSERFGLMSSLSGARCVFIATARLAGEDIPAAGASLLGEVSGLVTAAQVAVLLMLGQNLRD